MTKKIALAITFILLCVFAGLWYAHVLNSRSQNNISQSILSPAKTISTVIATSTANTLATTTSIVTESHPGMKLYRNAQWGFEFWYPKGWEWKENVFGSPNIRFNLTVMKINGKNTNQDDMINIVTPDFANREYQDIQNESTPFTVDNLQGLKYEYKEDINYIDIVIPINKDNTIIFGNEDRAHISEFNQIVSSFQFTK